MKSNPKTMAVLKAGSIGMVMAILSGCGPDGTLATNGGASERVAASSSETDADNAPAALRTTAALSRPAAPENFTAAAHLDGPVLRWNATEGATSYTIWRARVPPKYRPTSGLNFKHIGKTLDTEFRDGSAGKEIDYIYRVAAKNAAGRSQFSGTSCTWRPRTGDYPGVRPKVYVSVHGASFLGKEPEANQEQWSYVRMCLDGFYGNNSGVSPTEAYNLIRRTNTRNYIGIVNLNNFVSDEKSSQSTNDAVRAITDKLKPIEDISRIVRTHPDLKLKRGPLVAYTLFPQVWSMVTLADLRAAYINNDAVPENWKYTGVYMGSAIRNWEESKDYVELTKKPGPDDDVAGALSQPDARVMFRNADGHMVECLAGNCSGSGKRAQGFLEALEKTHKRGNDFLVFNSHANSAKTDWDQNMRQLFADGRPHWTENDIFMLVNYRNSYALLPEKNADGTSANTLTGNLHWLLHQ